MIDLIKFVPVILLLVSLIALAIMAKETAKKSGKYFFLTWLMFASAGLMFLFFVARFLALNEIAAWMETLVVIALLLFSLYHLMVEVSALRGR